MNLIIEGREICPQSDQSLLDILRKMELVTDRLSTNPLVAQIAGEVFTLNYIPVREKDAARSNCCIMKIPPVRPHILAPRNLLFSWR